MATVLEIPFEMPQPGREVKRGQQCLKLRANGLQCRMPAVDGHEYCLRHEIWYKLVPAVWGMPYPEDAVSLQEVMARTLDLLLAKRITPAMADAIQRLCRLMLKNLSRYNEEMQAAEKQESVVRSRESATELGPRVAFLAARNPLIPKILA